MKQEVRSIILVPPRLLYSYTMISMEAVFVPFIIMCSISMILKSKSILYIACIMPAWHSRLMNYSIISQRPNIERNIPRQTCNSFQNSPKPKEKTSQSKTQTNRQTNRRTYIIQHRNHTYKHTNKPFHINNTQFRKLKHKPNNNNNTRHFLPLQPIQIKLYNKTTETL